MTRYRNHLSILLMADGLWRIRIVVTMKARSKGSEVDGYERFEVGGPASGQGVDHSHGPESVLKS